MRCEPGYQWGQQRCNREGAGLLRFLRPNNHIRGFRERIGGRGCALGRPCTTYWLVLHGVHAPVGVRPSLRRRVRDGPCTWQILAMPHHVAGRRLIQN